MSQLCLMCPTTRKEGKRGRKRTGGKGRTMPLLDLLGDPNHSQVEGERVKT